MKSQIKSLKTMQVFTLVDRPTGAPVLPGKWVYDAKLETALNEWVKRARFVVCGNHEEDNWALDNIYAAVANSTSVKCFLIMITAKGYKRRQFDFKTAFLNTNVPKGTTIYVEQPPGIPNTDRTKVWLLNKALYGLRKSPLY